MRNMLLILRREYVERVHTKSFLILTFLVPVLMAGMIVLPVLVTRMTMRGPRRLVVATSNPELGKSIRQQLSPETAAGANTGARDNRVPLPAYTITLDSRMTEEERAALSRQVIEKKIDGFLWIGPQELQSRQVEYTSKDATNLGEGRSLELALQAAIMRDTLSGYGIKDQQVAELMKPVAVKTVQVQNGRAAGKSGAALFASALIMVLILYMSVIMYGIAVMRSVIEEKSSRIAEVMLSAVTPRQLLTGKLLGVGAVGLTQVAIWVAVGVAFSLPGLAAGSTFQLYLPMSTLVAFAGFFVLGYFLYSALYAALGSMVNREQDTQQLQFLVMLPLVASVVLLQPVLQTPGSQLAVWLSLIPFCAPLLMFVRVVISTPPLWQIALSVVLMVIAIYGTLVCSARIYRVGVLMYGKRATLPELLKWIKYA